MALLRRRGARLGHRGGALAVSFWTQVDEVQRHGFVMWEALIWGSSTDAGTIACLFLAREGAPPTWGAWVLLIACAALSVQFNVVAGVQQGDWLSVEAHVWMPALALVVLAAARAHSRWTRGQSTATRDGEETAGPRPSPNVHAKVLRIVRGNPGVTWRVIRDRTGLTDANAKRVLTAARKTLPAESDEIREPESLDPAPAHPNGRNG